MKLSTMPTPHNPQEPPPAEKEAGADGKAVQELRSLGRDLKAIRLQVEKKLDDSQSSEEWMQVGFIIDRLLFGLYLLFISISFITIMIIWLKSYSQ